MAGLGFVQFVILYFTLALLLPFTFIALITILHVVGFLIIVAAVFAVFLVVDTVNRRRRR